MVDELTFVNAQVSVGMDNKLRQIAAEMRVSRSDVIRQAVSEFIRVWEEEKGKKNGGSQTECVEVNQVEG
jgi:predicted transcriptional regulator